MQEVRLVTAVLDGIGPAMAARPVHRRHQLRPDLHRPNCCGLACQSISDQPITDGNGVHKPSILRRAVAGWGPLCDPRRSD